MNVHWTRTALRHLAAIHDHIAQDSPLYARQVVDRLTARSSQMRQFPQSGRAVPEYADVNVRQVLEGSYRIIYRVKAERLDVLAVIHGARRLPWRKPPG